MIKPEIGMGATYQIGGDCYPYTIIHIVRTKAGKPKMLILQQDKAIPVPGTDWPNIQYTYERNIDGRTIEAKPNQYGEWKFQSAFIFFPHRRLYLDPSF